MEHKRFMYLYSLQVLVGPDEWMDGSGNAMVTMLFGWCGGPYIIACIQLDCKSPRFDVEHSELASKVVGALV